MSSLDEEVIVDATVLKVMDDRCKVGAEVQAARECISLQEPAMAQQHMCHLKY